MPSKKKQSCMLCGDTVLGSLGVHLVQRHSRAELANNLIRVHKELEEKVNA